MEAAVTRMESQKQSRRTSGLAEHMDGQYRRRSNHFKELTEAMVGCNLWIRKESRRKVLDRLGVHGQHGYVNKKGLHYDHGDDCDQKGMSIRTYEVCIEIDLGIETHSFHFIARVMLCNTQYFIQDIS